MTLYFLLKYLHLIGASVLIGTGAGIAFFMLKVHLTSDPALIAAVAGGLAGQLSGAAADRRSASVSGRLLPHGKLDPTLSWAVPFDRSILAAGRLDPNPDAESFG